MQYIAILLFLRNQLIFAGYEPILSHNEKSYKKLKLKPISSINSTDL